MSRSGYATLIRGGTLVLPDPELGLRAVAGDLLMDGGRITRLGEIDEPPRGARVIYAGGCAVLPGLVQAHAHLNHTLARGATAGLSTTRWLRERVWPLEAAHTPQSVRAAARLAVAEMLRGGITAVQAMEAPQHADAVLEVLAESGMVAACGKSLIDDAEAAPHPLAQPTDVALAEAVDLAEAWDGAVGGRLRVLIAPYSALACSGACLSAIGELAATGPWRVHLHAAVSPEDSAMMEARCGLRELPWLAEAGLLGERVSLAGCVRLDPAEIDALADSGTHVVHTPRSDAQRGAGIAPVVEMIAGNVDIAIGSGSPAAASTLDMFREMRLVGHLQSAAQGAALLPPARLLELATRGGAVAMGRGSDIGVLRPGALADVVLVDLQAPHSTPDPDPIETLVHRCGAADVRSVWLGGQQVVAEGRLTLWDEEAVTREARREGRALLRRAGLA